MPAVINLLTSPAKLSVVHLLNTPKTPDDIAAALNITRQGADKQLKELEEYGIVERKWFIGYNRPKVEFYLTDLGSALYRDLEALERKFRKSGNDAFTAKIRALDLDMLEGRITVAKYNKEKRKLKESLKWFTDSGE